MSKFISVTEHFSNREMAINIDKISHIVQKEHYCAIHIDTYDKPFVLAVKQSIDMVYYSIRMAESL